MADVSQRQTDTPALDRIDRAITRIEAAVDARDADAADLARRHAALRARMAEAITALDAVLARGDIATDTDSDAA